MPTDLNQRAKAIVDLASGEVEPDEKDEARAAGGRKGGAQRAEKLSAERRSSIARKAAAARWGTEERSPADRP